MSNDFRTRDFFLKRLPWGWGGSLRSLSFLAKMAEAVAAAALDEMARQVANLVGDPPEVSAVCSDRRWPHLRKRAPLFCRGRPELLFAKAAQRRGGAAATSAEERAR